MNLDVSAISNSSNDGTPVGTPGSRQATIDRIRAQRARGSLSIPDSAVSSAASSPVSRARRDTSSATPMGMRSALERRQRLMELRQQGDNAAPKSPNTSIKSTRMLNKSVDSLDNLNQTATQDDTMLDSSLIGAEDDEEEEDLNEILAINQPLHILSLDWVGVSRVTEMSSQPQLVHPLPQPDPANFSFSSVVRTLTGAPFRTCGPSEMGLMMGRIELLGGQQTKASAEVSDALDNKGEDTPLVGNSQVEDGVFIGDNPVLVDILMSGESLSQQITSMVSSTVELSRVTQRTLRELQCNMRIEEQRRIVAEKIEVEAIPSNPNGIAGSKLLRNLKSTPVLRIIHDPFIEQVTQPVLPEVAEEYGGSIGNWNSLSTSKDRIGQVVQGKDLRRQARTILRINMYQMSLASHPLLIQEERLYFAMKNSYIKYSAIFENRTTGYLTYRLFALIAELRRASQKKDMTPDELVTLRTSYQDLIDTLPSLCELRASIDSISTSLYSNWKEIQDQRKRQNFVSTKANLYIKKVERDANDGSPKRRTNGPSRTDDEILDHLSTEGHDWGQLSSVLETVPLLLRSVKKLFMEENNENMDNSNKTLSKAAKWVRKNSNLYKPDDRAIQLAEESVKDLLKYRGLVPEYVMRLSDTFNVTPDNQVDAVELKRRRHLEGLNYKFVLKKDGKAVTSCQASVLHPSLTADINKSIELRLFTEPSEVSIDVSLVKKTGTESFLASVLIPLPGQRSGASGAEQMPSHVYAPVAGWYMFQVDDTSCSILCSAEYNVATSDQAFAQYKTNGIGGADLAMLPTQPDGSSSWGRVGDFTRERDFQSMLPDSRDVDVNDPRNDRLLSLKMGGAQIDDEKDIFHMAGKYASQYFMEEGEYYDNYIRFQESLRLKLLKLRDLKPHLFSAPIPLSEDAIRSSDVYASILRKEAGPMSKELMELTGREEERGVGNSEKVSSFLTKIRSSVTAQMKRENKNKITTSSVIAEYNYFVAAEDLRDIASLIPERKRSLKPSIKARVPQSTQVSKCNVLVQIVSARNVPLRKDPDGDKDKLNKSLNVPIDSAPANAPIIAEGLLDPLKVKDRKRARTFIEISFQNQVVSSTVTEGGAPLWKQSFSIPFKSPHNDFTPKSISMIEDDIHFVLFDETIEDDRDRGGFLEGENTIRTDKKYLASFTIPFPTLFYKGRIEGIFRFNTPVFNMGYVFNISHEDDLKKSGDALFANSEVLNQAEATDNKSIFSYLDFTRMYKQNHKKRLEELLPDPSGLIHTETMDEFDYYASTLTSTFVNLMVTLDPVLAVPNVSDDASVINKGSMFNDDRAFHSHTVQWLKEVKGYSGHTANRKYPLFATGSHGLNVFIPRFLTPMKPPPTFETKRACLHFITNLPYMIDTRMLVGELDLFCTAKEAMNIGAGDEEEHASILYNFLYYLSQQDNASAGNRVATGNTKNEMSLLSNGAYPSDDKVANETLFLAIGNAIPEGKTYYILMRDIRKKTSKFYDPENFLLINCCNGQIFAASDLRCTMTEIECLATPYNLWANIQPSGKPSAVNFNINDSSCWRPFFGKRLPPPSGGLQTIQEAVTFVPTSNSYVYEIEKSLKEGIKNGMRRWRSKRHRSTTTFHPDASSAVNDMLPLLEEWKKNGNKKKNPKQRRGDSDESSDLDSATSLDSIIEYVTNRLKPMLRNRRIIGAPFNIPFTDVNTALETIKDMSFHEANHPDVQFVVAVRAFPLFNELLSVWIYIGTIEPDGARKIA